MAAIAMQPQPLDAARDDHVMDTRTPSPVQRANSHDSSTHYSPDLSQEVAMLSTKLVNAINYQTNLDDSLQATKHELEMMKRENARIKAEKKSLDDLVANGFLIRKSSMDQTLEQIRVELTKERLAREEAEKSRKQTEGELETLTSALFEEANTMVAAARKDTEAVEKRNLQLKSQIKDTELLLGSQQEQLHDLKLTMEKMSERGDNDTAGRDSVPSTPVNSAAAVFDAMQLSPNVSQIADIPPEHPLHFSQILTPVLRNDVVAYTDFQELLKTAQRLPGHSRAGSSSTSNAGLTSISQTNLSTSSTPALPGAFSFSTNSSPQSATFASIAPPLKDSKFYKRALVEDIEPTLRLDLAPGLSFLSRRTVASSLLLGSMVVEPFLPSTKFYGPIFACSLCGESRKKEPYVRKHRFRTSEDEGAQRYPLCDYCLGRVRAAGDFVGFLRMVRDGHWRAESEDEQKGAWEEAIRLRERMFWARIGGGVIPNITARAGTPSTTALKSARASLEDIPEDNAKIEVGDAAGDAPQEEEAEKPAAPAPEEKLMDVVRSHRKSMSISRSSVVPPTAVPAVPATPLKSEEDERAPEAAAAAPKMAETAAAEPVAVPEPSVEPQVDTPAVEESDSTAEQPAAATVAAVEGKETPAINNVPGETKRKSTLGWGSQEPSVTVLNEPVSELPAPSTRKPETPIASTDSALSPKPSHSPERRSSAVLNRVRAMEAGSSSGLGEKKLPGAFD